jgi:16S rRNA (uracil1498-N3)-methyltransferase
MRGFTMLASRSPSSSRAPRLVPRIFCDARLGPGAQLSLAPDAAQHVARALRLKAGDELTLFDGRGGEYEASILRIDHGRVDVKLAGFRDVEREAPFRVGLVQGLPEADKMDWIIEKAVELGVSWIQPIVCDRSVVRLSGERAERRELHWKRVAIAACEQSGRNTLAEVRPTLSFQAWMSAPSEVRRWMLVPAAEPLAAQAPPDDPVEILVGPEGGLSEREDDIARGRGCVPVALGPRILRTETAPIAAVAAMHALWGDFRGS